MARLHTLLENTYYRTTLAEFKDFFIFFLLHSVDSWIGLNCHQFLM